MDILFWMGIFWAIGYLSFCSYKSGKHVGSVKGYNVGRRRGRRWRR